jgi:hypothetical protein
MAGWYETQEKDCLIDQKYVQNNIGAPKTEMGLGGSPQFRDPMKPISADGIYNIYSYEIRDNPSLGKYGLINTDNGTYQIDDETLINEFIEIPQDLMPVRVYIMDGHIDDLE